MANIKVKDLADTSSITTDNQLMVLTDDVSNIVQNISVENFINNIVSSDSDNGVTVGTDDKLYVDNSDSGVTAGTYQYPQNLEVDSKGKITSVTSGSPVAVPIATTETAGIVKPDGTSITVTSDGTISAQSSSRNIGEIVTSTTPLTDAGLHLLDGALIQGSGIYSDFVDYMANLYNDDPTANYFAQESTIYNYVKIGNPTNNNGILSGFSDSDYVQIPQAFPVVTSCKVVFKVKLSDFTRHQVLFSRASGYNQSLMLVRQNTAKFCCYDGSWIDGTTTLSANVDYWFGVSYSGTAFTGYLLQDNNYTKDTLPDFSQWSQEWTTTTTNFINNNLFNIGYNALSSGEYWSGSVDLNNCYIEVNGSLWWEGSSILTPEQSWQQSVTDYSVCGKFVYDSVNNTVRLPKVTGFTEGTITPTELGDLTQAGLPNITGNAWYANSAFSGSFGLVQDRTTDGCFKSGTPKNYYGLSINTSSLSSNAIGFDASGSNSIYGNSNTVQPQSIKVLYYIVIAISTKTDIQVDIDEIATDLNGKADVDLANTSPASTFIDKVSSWTMPDYTTGITRTWDTVYQAQDNVIVTWYVSGGGQNGQYAELYVGTTSNPDIKIDGGGNDQAGYYEGGWIIVPKGYYYKATGAGNYSRTLTEYPLKGAN